MWIAKPIEALSPAERQAWVRAQAALRGCGEMIPLSQTLTWARATCAAGGRAFLVMSPEEGVGGVVHAVAAGNFECTNGPLLHWEGPELPRQLATFAMAVSKLSRQFTSLTQRPRWEKPRFERRFLALPIEAAGISEAATILVRVAPDAPAQLASASPRLRRSWAAAQKRGVETTWTRASDLGEFVAGMRAFGKRRGFYVPEAAWFSALIEGDSFEDEGISFYRVDASAAGARTRLLVALTRECAHYLFGYDERSSDAPAALSTAAPAHFRVLDECRARGLPYYDLNGFLAGAETHPYAGVAGFKEQFRGEVVEYVSPEIIIRGGDSRAE